MTKNQNVEQNIKKTAEILIKLNDMPSSQKGYVLELNGYLWINL